MPNRLGMVYGADAGFVLSRDPDTILVPDAAFVRAERLPPITEQDPILRMPPDLAVDVVSPTDRPHEVAQKVGIYLAAGVPLVWIVEPRTRRITVHAPNQAPVVLSPGDELAGGEVLPGFRLPVSDVFLDQRDVTGV